MVVDSAGVDMEAVERAIRLCVQRFYAKGHEDALLGPVFAVHVSDWGDHINRITDFWSRVLLGTGRYDGRPFPPHVVLPVEPAHFARWLELFRETAHETLPPKYAEAAIERAELVAQSFQTALFPLKGGVRHPG